MRSPNLYDLTLSLTMSDQPWASDVLWANNTLYRWGLLVASTTLANFKKKKECVEAYIEADGKMTRMQSHIMECKPFARQLDSTMRDIDQVLEYGAPLG